MPTTDKKILIFEKKPITGGIPATENIIKAKLKAKPGLDFFNRVKLLSSLLYLFFKCLFFNLINKNKYQIKNPEII
jgi:hypothetical protein